MEIEKAQNGSELTVTLSGRLDTAPKLEAELKRSLDGVERRAPELLEDEAAAKASGGSYVWVSGWSKPERGDN